MMLGISPPVMALRVAQDPVAAGAPVWGGDDVALACSLFGAWAVRTGRVLRAVPVTELTVEELINFWADDQC